VLQRQTLGFMLAAAGLFAAGHLASAAQGADKNAELAKKAVEAFADGVVAKNIKALMQVVDVPWCDNLNMDGSKLIVKNDEKNPELKNRLEKLIGGSMEIPAKVVVEFKMILTYDKLLEKFGKGLPESERKILDQVLKKTDYILGVAIKSPAGEVLVELSFLVAVRDGKAKIVGLRG
jgi:hypothetical protein